MSFEDSLRWKFVGQESVITMEIKDELLTDFCIVVDVFWRQVLYAGNYSLFSLSLLMTKDSLAEI